MSRHAKIYQKYWCYLPQSCLINLAGEMERGRASWFSGIWLLKKETSLVFKVPHFPSFSPEHRAVGRPAWRYMVVHRSLFWRPNQERLRIIGTLATIIAGWEFTFSDGKYICRHLPTFSGGYSNFLHHDFSKKCLSALEAPIPAYCFIHDSCWYSLSFWVGRKWTQDFKIKDQEPQCSTIVDHLGRAQLQIIQRCRSQAKWVFHSRAKKNQLQNQQARPAGLPVKAGIFVGSFKRLVVGVLFGIQENKRKKPKPSSCWRDDFFSPQTPEKMGYNRSSSCEFHWPINICMFKLVSGKVSVFLKTLMLWMLFLKI